MSKAGVGILTVSLAGVPTIIATREETSRIYIDHVIAGRQGKTKAPMLSSSMNGQTIYMASKSTEMAALFRRFPVTSIDGQPAVVVSSFWRRSFPERVATTDLIHDVFLDGASHGVRHYLLGGSPLVVEEAASKLKLKYPDAQLVGWHHGYISDEQLPLIAREISNLNVEILWVCMGVPREQHVSLAIADLINKPLVIKTGGGVLDFVSGKNKRAPQWMQSIGAEWLFRLCLEPKRLFHRYIQSNPYALLSLVFSKPKYGRIYLRGR